jgi:hypothetical protein
MKTQDIVNRCSSLVVAALGFDRYEQLLESFDPTFGAAPLPIGRLGCEPGCRTTETEST